LTEVFVHTPTLVTGLHGLAHIFDFGATRFATE